MARAIFCAQTQGLGRLGTGFEPKPGPGLGAQTMARAVMDRDNQRRILDDTPAQGAGVFCTSNAGIIEDLPDCAGVFCTSNTVFPATLCRGVLH